MLNLNQLRVFNEAAKALNFTEAAKNLCVTQPAVTGMIKQFEDFCNLKLFVKHGSKIYLSPEGQMIFRHTSRLFEGEQRLEQVINELREGEKAPLCVALSPSYSWSLFPALLKCFHKSFPKSTIRLIEGNSTRMLEALLTHEVQIAIVPNVIDDERIKFIPFLQEEAILVVPPGHRFIESNPKSWEDIIGEPFVLKEKGSATRLHLNKRLGDRLTELNVIAETDNDRFAMELVKEGQGISFLVKTTVKRELDSGEVVAVPLPGPSVFFAICIAYLGDFYLSPTANRFITLVQEVIYRHDSLISIHDFLIVLKNSNSEGHSHIKT